MSRHRSVSPFAFILYTRQSNFSLKVKSYPDLPVIIQQYINSNVRQKDIPGMLESEHHIHIKLSLNLFLSAIFALAFNQTC